MNTYLLFKSIHLIAVISWMAGLLYLPRIFVYHSEAVAKNKSEDLMSTFKIMGEKTFYLYYESCNDCVLDFWRIINSYYWCG